MPLDERRDVGAAGEQVALPVLLLCQGWFLFKGDVDGARQLSLEAAEGFAAALSLGLFAGEVGAGGWVDAEAFAVYRVVA